MYQCWKFHIFEYLHTPSRAHTHTHTHTNNQSTHKQTRLRYTSNCRSQNKYSMILLWKSANTKYIHYISYILLLDGWIQLISNVIHGCCIKNVIIYQHRTLSSSIPETRTKLHMSVPTAMEFTPLSYDSWNLSQRFNNWLLIGILSTSLVRKIVLYNNWKLRRTSFFKATQIASNQVELRSHSWDSNPGICVLQLSYGFEIWHSDEQDGCMETCKFLERLKHPTREHYQYLWATVKYPHAL